jgi:hypothetical protein
MIVRFVMTAHARIFSGFMVLSPAPFPAAKPNATQQGQARRL